MSERAERRNASLLESEAIACLKLVSYPPASWDKRFVRMLAINTITDKEAPQVWRLFKRYRRQIEHPSKAILLSKADDLAAPDFRKQQAEERAKRKLQEWNEGS